MVLLRKRHAQSAPQNLPDTRGWQLVDFVFYLQPFADTVKSNHTALRQGKTRQTAASAQRQNAAYLDYMHRVLQTMANPIRAEAEVIGDTHFGMKHTNDLELLVYLHSIQPDHLFLNGDIVDHLVIESRHDINPVQRAAIRRIRDMKKQGCEVVRLRGNHDLGANRAEGDPGYGGVPIYRAVKFMSGDGSSTLITHGDQFDSIVGGNSWLEHLGSRAYEIMVIINHYHKRICYALHQPHWSLASFCKKLSKRICLAMSHFDDKVFGMAKKEGAEFFICGHTHIPMHAERGGCKYLNPGDWVEASGVLRKMPGEGWQILLPMQRLEHQIQPKQHPPARHAPQPLPSINLGQAAIIAARSVLVRAA